MAYYDNVNPDLLACLPLTALRVLEIGCGAGGLARAYKARNPNVYYVGVELFQAAAEQAAQWLDHVILGSIETPEVQQALTDVQQGQLFDVLILGDVLEHLRDPWNVLTELRTRMTAGGICLACIPNVSHWSIVRSLLTGRWDYAEQGLLDRTHLRFFTLDTSVEMFMKAGWKLIDASPRILWPDKTREAVSAIQPAAYALGIPAQRLERDLSAFQWVIRAVNGAVPRVLHIWALTLNKQAGVTEARIEYPLTALNTLPQMRCRWQAGGISIPSNVPAGVFILQRQIMDEPSVVDFVEHQIQKGWIVVTDFDDDPRHWSRIRDSHFATFRNVHAVTVSSEPLADLIRQWNPNVQVFPNAVFELPEIPSATPKQEGCLRIFFGALNRSQDWRQVQDGIIAAAQLLAERVEFVIVHDKAVFETLPASVRKVFHATLPHDLYMQQLASCDIALLPLADTEFNRFKSDLKFIECCAAGVVPLCSQIVYAATARHREIGIFATTAEDWRVALLELCHQPEDIVRRRALALDYVRNERLHSQQVAARERYYCDLVSHREVLEAQRQRRRIL